MEPIEDLYFNWLYSKVVPPTGVPPTPSTSYLKLCRTLHSIEFVWIVVGDDNRAADGVDLRTEFIRTASGYELDWDASWLTQPVSVLEVIVAFSKICEFETEIPSVEWIWIMLENVDLSDQTDAHLGVCDFTTEVIDQVIWRTYQEDGHGGLFPLLEAYEDQTKVEIWYQFCAYLVDRSIF